MSKYPIGFFDSGIGGTSIWKEVVKLLPNENTIYLCDSKNSPYGTKPKEEIIHICEKKTEALLNFNAKIIVVACNTATTNAISHLRKKYHIPFIGIEPAIKPASLVTKTNTIGVLATKGTIDSELFENTSSKIDNQIKIVSRIGTGIVELIEDGKMYSDEMTTMLTSHLSPLLEAKIDALVLGCTHYPYLIPQINKLIPENIQIIDSGEAVAKQTKAIIEKNSLQNISKDLGFHELITNGNKEVLKQVIKSSNDVLIKTGMF